MVLIKGGRDIPQVKKNKGQNKCVTKIFSNLGVPDKM